MHMNPARRPPSGYSASCFACMNRQAGIWHEATDVPTLVQEVLTTSTQTFNCSPRHSWTNIPAMKVCRAVLSSAIIRSACRACHCTSCISAHPPSPRLRVRIPTSSMTMRTCSRQPTRQMRAYTCHMSKSAVVEPGNYRVPSASVCMPQATATLTGFRMRRCALLPAQPWPWPPPLALRTRTCQPSLPQPPRCQCRTAVK